VMQGLNVTRDDVSRASIFRGSVIVVLAFHKKTAERAARAKLQDGLTITYDGEEYTALAPHTETATTSAAFTYVIVCVAALAVLLVFGVPFFRKRM
jgi:hypothetical protein